jgi:hypothetical protein
MIRFSCSILALLLTYYVPDYDLTMQTTMKALTNMQPQKTVYDDMSSNLVVGVLRPNELFICLRYRLTGNLPHILVLNKEDLVRNSEKQRIADLVKKSDPHLTDVIFTNCKDDRNVGLKKVGYFPPSICCHLSTFKFDS